MKVGVKVTINALDETIHFSSFVQDDEVMIYINHWLIDTQETAVRDALIKLGWTPPSEVKP